MSVITAVDPTTSEHLPATYASLAAQVLPSAWDVEWLVQCDTVDADGQESVRRQLPSDDQRLHYSASRHGGPGVARTMALARAAGDLVKVLDADDQLAPGVLGRDIRACSTAGVGWSTSRVLDLHTDGTTAQHRPDNPGAGRATAGVVGDYWEAHEWGILVHPASLCARRRLVVALGGWMALPASEDTGLLLALDAVSDGWFHDEVGMYYRRWPPQMSAAPAHVEATERAGRRALITARKDALAELLESRRSPAEGASEGQSHL